MKFIARNTLIISVIIVISGCSQNGEQHTSKAVEDLTGYSTIKKAEAMKNNIKQIENLLEERENNIDSIQ